MIAMYEKHAKSVAFYKVSFLKHRELSLSLARLLHYLLNIVFYRQLSSAIPREVWLSLVESLWQS